MYEPKIKMGPIPHIIRVKLQPLANPRARPLSDMDRLKII